jgi:hypothetical protein
VSVSLAVSRANSFGFSSDGTSIPSGHGASGRFAELVDSLRRGVSPGSRPWRHAAEVSEKMHVRFRVAQREHGWEPEH